MQWQLLCCDPHSRCTFETGLQHSYQRQGAALSDILRAADNVKKETTAITKSKKQKAKTKNPPVALRQKTTRELRQPNTSNLSSSLTVKPKAT